EDLIFSSEIDHVRPTAKGIGKAFRIDDAEGRYIEFAKNSFPKDMNLEGFKVVVDCANGAAYKIMPMILRELGAEVIVIGDKPDGLNINLDCGSLHPEKVQKIVIDHGADIGISHDGDADRAIFSCEEGGLVDGDQVMAACAIAMKRNGMLKGDTLITTTMSNLGLEIAMKQHGIRLIRTQVGDRYVMDEIISGGYNLGGEQSGHIIFYDHNTTGDGIITSLQLLALMKKTGRRLSDLASSMVRLPQILINVKIREKADLDSIGAVSEKVKDVNKRLGDTGRLLIRYSGTEPLVRIMIEGLREDEIRVMAEDLAVAIRGSIGA
ncbi:MAG: phosphoglucosamine mutase, partial [Nitrospirota bacterium]